MIKFVYNIIQYFYNIIRTSLRLFTFFLLVFIEDLFSSSFNCDMSAVCFAEILSLTYGIVIQSQANNYSRVSFMFAIKRNLV
jgi:hypothetical protein